MLCFKKPKTPMCLPLSCVAGGSTMLRMGGRHHDRKLLRSAYASADTSSPEPFFSANASSCVHVPPLRM